MNEWADGRYVTIRSVDMMYVEDVKVRLDKDERIVGVKDVQLSPGEHLVRVFIERPAEGDDE